MKISLYTDNLDEDEEDDIVISDRAHRWTVIGLLVAFVVMFGALIYIGQWPVCLILAAVANFAYQGVKN